MAQKHHIYLVPGFFGFANLGDLAYFGHVRDFLAQACPEAGMEVEVHVVKTPPTASLPIRAARLLESVAETAANDDAPIHLIGHSSGGLDARLFVAPNNNLPTAFSPEPYAARVRTVLCVSTPHRGTPVASFFTSLLGQKLLEVLSLSTIYVLRAGRFPLSVLAKLGALFGKLEGEQAEDVMSELLTDFSEERRGAIAQFLHHIREDQGLMLQLAPAGMDIFNASTQDRPGVRYASVLTRARRPSLGSRLSAGFNASAHATHTVFDALYRIAATMPEEKVAVLTEPWKKAMLDAYGELPLASDNDGVVPTLSQPWGEIIYCAMADHLDAIGHFDDRTHKPPHFDWVTTGTGFQRRDYDALWTTVAKYLVS
jgi:triacylglycerol lipase